MSHGADVALVATSWLVAQATAGPMASPRVAGIAGSIAFSHNEPSRTPPEIRAWPLLGDVR